jgi:8-oxo-dGTP diphosphatase
MKPKKLPYHKFLESFKYAPRPAVNLFVERKVSDTLQVLLTRRRKPPFAGSWHLPGSFVLRGEALMDCVKRVAKEELGIKLDKKNIQLAGAFDDLAGDPRGHVVDLVYQIRPGLFKKARPLKAIGDTTEIKFFQKLPENIGFNHRETLAKLGFI